MVAPATRLFLLLQTQLSVEEEEAVERSRRSYRANQKSFSPLNRRGGSGVARWRERGMSLPLRFVG